MNPEYITGFNELNDFENEIMKTLKFHYDHNNGMIACGEVKKLLIKVKGYYSHSESSTSEELK